LGDIMNIRCGIDIVELDRFSRALSTGDSFKNKVFTPNERSYCESLGKNSLQSYAARFCAKEAVAKALGTGISKGISFQDIEVLNEENGKPTVYLHGEAANIYEMLGSKAIDISLTHSRDYAAAQAVILTGE
jgi:holo-[acyl-carrier protein] synthase